MVMPGLINLDFADIKTVMSEMGKAMMGTGDAEGERRAIEAAEAAISNPLLDDVSMKGARGILINITGGYDMTLYEVDEAANRIREEVDPDANIIFGSTFNEKMNGRMRVSVVATGIDAASVQQKKKAFEEMVSAKGVRMDGFADADGRISVLVSEGNQSPSMGAAAEPSEKTAAVLGVVSNTALQEVTLEKDDDNRENNNKSPSLFERLTVMRRSFSSNKTTENYVVKNGTQMKHSQEEDLEIPAFLRRKQ
jgi:cell division protein FtsZ